MPYLIGSGRGAIIVLTMFQTMPIADRRYRIGERLVRIKVLARETTDRRLPISGRGNVYEQYLIYEGNRRSPISPMALSDRDFIDRHDNGAQENGRLPISPIALSGRGMADGRNNDAQGNVDGRYRR